MPSSACQTCARSEEHTSELQSHSHLVCRLLLEKKQSGDNAGTSALVSLSALFRARPRVAVNGITGSVVSFSALLRPVSRMGPRFFFKEIATPEASPLSSRAVLPI